MTPRERINAALRHEEPDRIPVDLGASESSGIMGIAYNALREHLGLGSRTQIYDISQVIAKVEMPILDHIGADALPLLIEPRRWKPWTLQDGSPCEIPEGLDITPHADGGWAILRDDGTPAAVNPAGSYYFDPINPPLADANTPQDIEARIEHLLSFDWPDYLDEDYDDLARKARCLHEETDRFIVANLWVHVFAAGQILRGFETFMTDLIADKTLAHYLMGRLVECYAERVRRYFEAVGPWVDIVQVNDDLGTQSGPQLSPELYREMVKPYHARLWGMIKEQSGKPLLLHSCGSIHDLLPDLIEIGVDAINPVQVTAANMDGELLKARFGDVLTFWGGGCDTQQVLGAGTPEQVKDEVRRRCEQFAPGGGFVFCQVHNIQPDVPPENVMAMYEALDEL
ncbi:MAG: methyltransferase [Armatimonadetes bacterium]|nr:methyltransferase [Armatimonadota bacterium]